MPYDLEKIKDPSQIRNLSLDELEALASEIRLFLLTSLSRTGGHLSSNLGMVELTIAMHYVFNSPRDKIIFDVGHQSYTHKILTGRAQRFQTLRQKDGLSGFQRRQESEHDPWEAGHSSTSLSAAMGLAVARDIRKEDFQIVSVIGDGALTGGMAMEALNHLGANKRKMVIVFNDNKMSISRNAGGAEQALTRLRSSSFYRNTKNELNSSLPGLPMGKPILNLLHSSHHYLKHQMLTENLFTQFNLDYIGPVDGHNLHDLIPVLEMARDHDGPIVVHVITTKGKGYVPAEKDTTGKWHGVGPFELSTGKLLQKSDAHMLSWSEIICRTLVDMARKDPSITAITPAMTGGSKLGLFEKLFPDRFFDCGIAEEHAMTMAAGMAQGGLKPFLSIYSSFLQRAYDQASHDVARMNLPVVVGIDRAGLVGEDGDTHQGIYDIAFLRTIPNVILCQPKDAQEAQQLLAAGFACHKPFFIRYPKGNVLYRKMQNPEPVRIGSWTSQKLGDPKQIVITYGPDFDRLEQRARQENLELLLVNARFFKPVDHALLHRLVQMHLPVTVYAPDTTSGGLPDAILEEINRMEDVQPVHIDVIGIEDKFVPHGSIEALRKMEGISLDDVIERLKQHALG